MQRHALLSLIGFAALVSAVNAQDTKPKRGTPPEAARSVLTGKERLGRKWTDEQRIDNCNVPIDKRGTKPRPDTCWSAPSS